MLRMPMMNVNRFFIASTVIMDDTIRINLIRVSQEN